MNALIVFAHPASTSFSAALKDTAVETLAGLGYDVAVSDLYASRFSAAGDRHDFKHPLDEPFDYQAEQRKAWEGRTFSDEILAEQDKLSRSDVILLNFPMWWFGPPAILKGWIDRVLSAGFAYDRNARFETGRFLGKRGLLTVTTGSPAERYRSEGVHAYAPIEDTLLPLKKGVLEYVGISALKPFVAYAAKSASQDQRSTYLNLYNAHLISEVGRPRRSSTG
jgi:NAD(P)H dehydrogenase (quinone)